MTNVLIVRGHLVTPWELRPWQDLPERFEVSYLRTASNGYDTSALDLDEVSVSALRDRLPKGLLGEVATGLLRDRYGSDADLAFEQSDIVHSEELAFWFAADASRRKLAGASFKLVQTVWETLPLSGAYRSRGARVFREDVLAATDLFLAATERARVALLLEGVPEEKVMVCQPGIDTERFSGARTAPDEQTFVILSPGRLVWEKGHQDAIRAVALLSRGIVGNLPSTGKNLRLRIVGSGPEQARLEEHARELGVGHLVSFESLPYDEMPSAFAQASGLVLGSLPAARGGFHPFDHPRFFWEEQFGMVFAEAMAARLDIITSDSGAIPEVLGGSGTVLPAGDYIGIAKALWKGPLSRPPGARVEYPPELVEFYGARAAAGRLASAYDRVLSEA